MVRVAAEDQTRRAARSRFHPLQRFTVSAAGLVAAGAAVVSEHRLRCVGPVRLQCSAGLVIRKISLADF